VCYVLNLYRGDKTIEGNIFTMKEYIDLNVSTLG
jgi:hypothetical protein